MGYGYNNGGRGGYGGGGQRTQQRPQGQRNGNNRCTQKQANILQEFGYDTNVSFQQASQIIDGIARNGWQRPNAPPRGQRNGQGAPGNHRQSGNRPPQQRNGNNRCTARQAEVLQEFGYDPNVSFDEARTILDELAANGWQRHDAGQGDAPYDNGQGGADGYYDSGDGYQAEVGYGEGGY